MTALIVLYCIAAVLATYPWWPDVQHFLRWRIHLHQRRRRHAREWAEYKRRNPLVCLGVSLTIGFLVLRGCSDYFWYRAASWFAEKYL